MGKNNRTNSYTDFYYHLFRNVLIVALPILFISAIILSSLHISATGSTSDSDNLVITISSSCTLSSVVNIPHSTEVYNGNYLGNIGKTTITTLCNDGNGYSVYANGYSNNEEGNNKLINSSYPQYSIDTGLASSGLTSTWAMKLNNIPDDPSPTPPTIETEYNNTYGIVPAYWTKVASRESGTTDMAQGSSFTTTYAVYASSSQYAGTYQGQVKYVLVHPNINKQNLNNLELAFGSHGVQPAYQDETGSYFAMQDMTTDICNSVSGYGEATATQLVDTRDNKLYYVAKLADGHCWMTQNLDLDIKANTTLNSNTTDLNVIYNSFTGQYAEYNDGYTVNNDVIYWKPASTATTIGFEGDTMTNWYASETAPASASKIDDTSTGHTSLGNYYNWSAAIVSNNSSSLTTQYTVASNSICPKGWRLPVAANVDRSIYEFGDLLYAYDVTVQRIGSNSSETKYKTGGFEKIRSAPLWFKWEDGKSSSRYWSSAVSADNVAYSLYFDSSRAYPALYNPPWTKNASASFVRCVVR